MHPALLTALLALALLCAGMVDWGELAGGMRRLTQLVWRGKERVRLRAVWRLELGTLQPDGSLLVRERREVGENVIVNAGLDALKDRLFNPATAVPGFFWIGIGTNAVPETTADVALGAEVARGGTTYTAGGTGVCTIERTFAAGVGTGAITEAGAFNANAAGTMFNRKTFPVVNKTVADTLKVTCVITAA